MSHEHDAVFVCQVALVYPNNDPISFMCAFYGCLTAGVVPVPIEVPLTKRVSAQAPTHQDPQVSTRTRKPRSGGSQPQIGHPPRRLKQAPLQS